MGYLIKGKEIYTSNGILKETNILVEKDRIKGINVKENKNYEIIDLSKYKILPGLIDIHTHGAIGYDVMDCSYKAINEISKYKAFNGVTSFLATIITAPIEKIKKAVINIEKSIEKGLNGAKLLGSYLEGPYISKKYRGAHLEDFIREIDINEIEEIVKLSRNTLKIIAIAPEKDNSKEVIKNLVKKDIIIALGHTNADYDNAIEAINLGANLAVHVYNCMRGLHHRQPGMLGAVLNKDDIYAELISDGIHVDKAAIQILLKCKKEEKIILITDCMMAGGLKDGEYKLGELKVNVREGIARTYDGVLAGSTLRLLDGIKYMVEEVKIPFEKVLKMATINPATLLGLDKEIGSIDIEKKADIIAIDENYKVIFTMIDGKIIF